MAKTPIQFPKDLRLNAFPYRCGSEEQYADTTIAWRWTRGFVCPDRGHGDGFFALRPPVLEQALSPQSLADRRNNLCLQQAAFGHLISRHGPAHSAQQRHLRHCARAP
jgi:hypothetical protein